VDEETARWLAELADPGRVGEQAQRRLHDLLLRAARAELNRRSAQHPVIGPELDDLAHQAADDALLSITTKLAQFRGESRFTTWAYKFAILEVSNKLGRHFWSRHPTVALDAPDWNRLPDQFGMRPDEYVQHRDLITAVRRAVEQELTERQRQVFLALAVDGIPLDALALRLKSNRNAIYKTMFDARRKLRAALAANGYLPTFARSSEVSEDEAGGRTRNGAGGRGSGEAIMTGWAELERFLDTDPRDVGCEQAMHLLHGYVDLGHDDASRAEAARRYPGIAAHLLACGPCGEDYRGLVLAMQRRWS
jgi:RNA polymerase sigma-70 factor (ECF subfamily)